MAVLRPFGYFSEWALHLYRGSMVWESIDRVFAIVSSVATVIALVLSLRKPSVESRDTGPTNPQAARTVGTLIFGLFAIGYSSVRAFSAEFSWASLAISLAGFLALTITCFQVMRSDLSRRARYATLAAQILFMIAGLIIVGRSFTTRNDSCVVGEWQSTFGEWGKRTGGVGVPLVFAENGTGAYGDGTETVYRPNPRSNEEPISENPLQTFKYKAYDGKLFVLESAGDGFFAGVLRTGWDLFDERDYASYTCSNTRLDIVWESDMRMSFKRAS